MKASEISLHQLRVWEFVRDLGTWVSVADIQQATGVCPRTARHHARNLTDQGLLERVDVFPGARFRVLPDPERRNPELMARLERAREAFGEVA